MARKESPQNRKDSHLALCLGEQVEFSEGGASGFGHYRFEHDALPELSKAEISLETSFLGKKLAVPFLIGAMTGGTKRAAEFNRRLALAAETCQIGLALGSQRPMLENPSTRRSYTVREHAPALPLLVGNLGAVQLNYGVGVKEVKALIMETGCDAFCFHLNPLQEAIQSEGDTNFSNLRAQLQRLVPQLKVPVLVKEVGAGISEVTARKLRSLPIYGVETAGVGGTSWAKVEGLRAKQPLKRTLGDTFARWGVPTAESIEVCRKTLLPRQRIVASGGIRNGIEAAKALALGADAVAFALPMLKAAEESTEAVIETIIRIKEELRMVMFLTGSHTISDLRKGKLRKVKDLSGG